MKIISVRDLTLVEDNLMGLKVFIHKFILCFKYILLLWNCYTNYGIFCHKKEDVDFDNRWKECLLGEGRSIETSGGWSGKEEWSRRGRDEET